jgi:hypothetical protein
MSDDKKDFNALVDLAMADPALSAMRPVVEKELLHYAIFQALDAEGLLKDLVFQGGTSLRLCRGSDRFSEDLDFAGGTDFSADGMRRIKACVETRIGFGQPGSTSSSRLQQDPAPRHLGSGVDVGAWRQAQSAACGRQDRRLQRGGLPWPMTPTRTTWPWPSVAFSRR